jgi:alpha/beta hydrolase family protein
VAGIRARKARPGRLVFDDELLDAQLLRTVGAAPYGGADVGESLAAARRVKGTDLDSWYAEWTQLAAATAAMGASELAAGREETARAAFFRAANYHRNAAVMLMGPPLGDRLRSSNATQTEVFRQGAALLASPPEIVEIPFEGTTLPGYHFRAAGADPRPTVILLGGYDGTVEELYFFNGAAALARGYDVLAFDGPGQGGALIQQGLVMRADYGPVVTAVLDFLLERAGADPRRVALIGLSLGGFVAPRAGRAHPLPRPRLRLARRDHETGPRNRDR